MLGSLQLLWVSTGTSLSVRQSQGQGLALPLCRRFVFSACVSEPSHPPGLQAEHHLGLQCLTLLLPLLPWNLVMEEGANVLLGFPEPTHVLWWQSTELLPSSCSCPLGSCLQAMIGAGAGLDAVCPMPAPPNGFPELRCLHLAPESKLKDVPACQKLIPLLVFQVCPLYPKGFVWWAD